MFDLLSSKEEILEIARQVVDDIDIKFVQGSPAGTSCMMENNHPTIIWDLDYWEYIEQNAFLTDTLPYELETDLKIITELFYNFHGVLYYHLSKRYAKEHAISSAFVNAANECNYSFFKALYMKSFDVSVWKDRYELSMYVCKLLALYHELAHIVFQRDSQTKKEFEDMVIFNLSAWLDSYGSDYVKFFKEYNPERLSAQWYSNIVHGFIGREPQYMHLLEEIAADTYAVSKTHATLFLNYHSVGYQNVSTSLLAGMVTYYTHISYYPSICSFWDRLLPDLWLLKEHPSEDQNAPVSSYDSDIVIRAQIFPVVAFFIVHGLDEQKWEAANDSDFMEALEKEIHAGSVNDRWFRLAFDSTMNRENYIKILDSAIQIKQSVIYIAPSLIEVPEDALIISWGSLQYHNNKGIYLKDRGNYLEAIEEFQISAAISERYLGHNHRFTARAYNNIVDSFLRLHQQEYFNSGYLAQAKFFSQIAINIIEEIDALEGITAAMIFQNAGVIEQWSGNPKEAIRLYLKAREIKLQLSDYNYSVALTDSSLASAYFDIGEPELSKHFCTEVIRHLTKTHTSPEDPLYLNMMQLLSLLESS